MKPATSWDLAAAESVAERVNAAPMPTADKPTLK